MKNPFFIIVGEKRQTKKPTKKKLYPISHTYRALHSCTEDVVRKNWLYSHLNKEYFSHILCLAMFEIDVMWRVAVWQEVQHTVTASSAGLFFSVFTLALCLVFFGAIQSSLNIIYDELHVPFLPIYLPFMMMMIGWKKDDSLWLIYRIFAYIYKTLMGAFVYVAILRRYDYIDMK